MKTARNELTRNDIVNKVGSTQDRHEGGYYNPMSNKPGNPRGEHLGCTTLGTDPHEKWLRERLRYVWINT